MIQIKPDQIILILLGSHYVESQKKKKTLGQEGAREPTSLMLLGPKLVPVIHHLADTCEGPRTRQCLYLLAHKLATVTVETYDGYFPLA